MTGALIGGAIALGFWSVTFTGLDRRVPGALGSGGVLALVALCLWFDGWIAVALAAFCIAFSCLLALGGGGRGPRRAPDRRAPRPAAPPRRADAWAFAPLPARTGFAASSGHRDLATANAPGN